MNNRFMRTNGLVPTWLYWTEFTTGVFFTTIFDKLERLSDEKVSFTH